ncbi:MAG: TraX family protein [Aristaeellaceae bacterium]
MSRKQSQPIAGNTSTGMLKIIALVFMFLDHLGIVCFTGVTELRMLGRIAFPLYCWCMVVGACHTRSMGRYVLRLALVGLLTQPLYMVALNHPWNVPNIFFTLMIGLCAIWGMQEKKWLSHLWAPALAILASQVLNCGAASYGWKGVLLMMLLWAVRDSRRGIAATMIAFCLYWGAGGISVTSIFGISLAPLTRSSLGTLFTPWLRLQTMALMALPFMLWPDEMHIPVPSFLRADGDSRTQITLRTRMPRLVMPRWLSYTLYPLHLVLLLLIEVIAFAVRQLPSLPAGLTLPETFGRLWQMMEAQNVVNYNHIVDAWHQLLALF